MEKLNDDKILKDSFTGCSDAAGVAEVLEKKSSDTAFIKAFADCVGQNLAEIAGTSKIESGIYKISGLSAGYYLVKDKDGIEFEYDAYTDFILQVVKDTNVEPKSDVPEFEKKVIDRNDTTDKSTDWQDSADYDIGDRIPFRLTGKVADNYDDYKTYKFIFHDKEDPGLTFDKESVEVKVDG